MPYFRSQGAKVHLLQYGIWNVTLPQKRTFSLPDTRQKAPGRHSGKGTGYSGCRPSTLLWHPGNPGSREEKSLSPGKPGFDGNEGGRKAPWFHR